MKNKLIVDQADDFFQFLVDELGFFSENNGRESISKVSDEFGQGFFSRIILRKGIEIYIADLLLKKRLRINYRMNRSLIEVCSCLAGYINHHEENLSQTSCFNAGQMGFFLQDNREGWVEYPVGVRCELISVGVVASRLLKSFSFHDSLKFTVNDLFDISSQNLNHLIHPQKINPVLLIPFHQIKKCSFRGVTKLMYLESRALEVLSLAFEMEIFTNKQNYNFKKIRESDKKRIHEVKELMAENMINPLTINQLARKVGINTFKLKTGFKQLYGTTIFGYLRDLRLEKARTLLENREMNISQIANEVGYANPSHFTAAFRKKFGCNPSTLRFFNNFR